MPTSTDGKRDFDSLINMMKSKYKALIKADREENLLSNVREATTGSTDSKSKKSKTCDSRSSNNNKGDNSCMNSSYSYCRCTIAMTKSNYDKNTNVLV